MTKTVLMCGIAISAIALVITPAEAKKRHHKAVDSQAAQTRELNLVSLQQAKQQGGAQQGAAQSASASPSNTDEAQQANNSKLPDLQGADAEVKADQANRTAAAQAPATTAASGRTIALGEVANPKQTLAKATIETKDGQKIGEVAQVETDANGKASAVMMTAQGGGNTRLDASKLSFMPDRGVLVSELTPADVKARTPARPETPSTPQTPAEPQSPAEPVTPTTPPSPAEPRH